MRQAALVFAAVGLALVTREVRLVAFEQHQRAQRYEDIYYLPRSAWLPVLSLGYRQALADLIWCKSLVYFGEDIGHRGPVRYVFEYTDAILALDPGFRSAYRWVATAAIYRPVAIDIDDGLRAAAYLKRALARWPDDGELHWDYGSLLRFELAPLEQDRARKQALLERAAPHLQTAARLGAGPAWLALNNVDLLNKLGRTEQAIRHLEELYGTIGNAEVKREIEEQLAGLRSRAYAEAIGAANEQFERDRIASYPYLSAGLFLLLGGRPAPDAHARFLANSFSDEKPTLDLSDQTPSAD